MTTDLKRFRRLCSGRNHLGGRYRSTAREAAALHAVSVIEGGGTVAEAAADLGLRESTIHGWLDEFAFMDNFTQAPSGVARFAAVEVVAADVPAIDTDRTFEIESISGLRVAGLNIDEVIAVLRSVSGC